MNRLRGYSMVELMVAMALGLLISAAAIQLFLANQVSLNFQRGMNDVQANGRFIIDQMVRDTRLSGLSTEESGITGAGGVIALPFAAADVAGLANTSTAFNRNSHTLALTTAGLLQDSDQLVVQRIALTGTEVDCEGNTVPAAAVPNIIIARYFIRLDGGVPSLACDGGYSNGVAVFNYGDAGAVLLSGVESFQVLYGVDDRIITNAGNGAANVARYIPANTYALLAAPRPTVLAVRIGLYMRSQDRAGNTSPPAQNIQILDNLLQSPNIPDDNRLRRLFISTVRLRNVSMGGV